MYIFGLQAGFRKGRGTRDQLANIWQVIEKARKFQKETLISAVLTILKPLSMWITTNWKILKELGIPDHLTCLLRNLHADQQLEQDMEQTGSKLGKEYVKAVYCCPAYLTYMQSTSCKIPGFMKHKLESRWPAEIAITSDVQMSLPLWQKVKN